MRPVTATRRLAIDARMKDSFFDAVVEVLSEHGVDGMTMERVACAAGVAKGSLYNYFRSKTDLVRFVYTKAIDPIFADLSAMVAADLPAVEKLTRHLRTLLAHAARHSRVFRILLQDETAQRLLEDSHRSTHAAVNQGLARIFRQGIDEGVFRPQDPLVFAQMFVGICRAFLDGRPALETTEAREESLASIMDILLNGVAEKVPTAAVSSIGVRR